MRIKIGLFCLIMSLTMGYGFVYGEEVTLHHQGLTLNAELLLTPGKSLSDGVILITHAGLAHRGMETVTQLQSLLNEDGYSTLAINLSLGLDNRHGMYDCKTTHQHHYADAAEEIGAWMDWLKKQGVRRVVLLGGHSRGGAQTALYASEHDDPLVSVVVLLAPDTRETNGATVYQQRYHKPLAQVLDKATKQVQNGKGKTVLEHTDFLYCPDTSVTAETFVSYYGPDPRLDTAYLLPKIKRQTLVVLAGDDEIVVNKEKFLPLADGQRLQIMVIEGSGHFFRDLYLEDAVDAIAKFLESSAF